MSLIIKGVEKWLSLPKLDTTTKVLKLYDCPDFNPIGNVPIFKNVTHLSYVQCDKNFVYYTIGITCFPKLEHLYICSHPCDPSTFRRYQNKAVTLYVSDHYRNYVERWATEMDNVKVVKHDELITIIEKLE